MARTKQRANNRKSQLLAGWFALLLYAGAASPIGLGIAAVFGTLDPDHKALLQMGSAGMRLVLHHEQKCAGHEHHLVARTLTFFAQPAGETDPDHVLQFASADGFWRDTLQIVSCNDSDESPDLVWFESISFSANLPWYSLPPPSPPPVTSGNLLCLRSTVLLV